MVVMVKKIFKRYQGYICLGMEGKDFILAVSFYHILKTTSRNITMTVGQV